MGAITRLIDALKNPESSTRAGAAEQLAAMGANARDAVPALIRALDDPSFIVQLWAVRALGAVGAEARDAVPRLSRAIDDDALRVFALIALGKIGPDAAAALDRIRQIAAGSKVDEVCEAAAMALYRIEGSAHEATIVLQALITMGRDAKARMHAAADLGIIGEAEAVPALIRALEDAAGGVRREAAGALGSIGIAAKPALPGLEKLLADKRDDGARLAAAEALWRIDKKISGLSFLCTLVQRTGTYRTGNPGELSGPPQAKDGAIRARAARAIGEMRERARPAVPVLIEALDDPAPEELKVAIAEALLKIQPGFS